VIEKDNWLSDALQRPMKESPKRVQVWMTAVRALSGASSLDVRTQVPACLAVLAAVGPESEVACRAAHAR
jgi:hypothetical protein